MADGATSKGGGISMSKYNLYKSVTVELPDGVCVRLDDDGVVISDEANVTRLSFRFVQAIIDLVEWIPEDDEGCKCNR